ncbi:MAG: type IV pilus twitching motility protein PilT [Kiritimatiellae bacterium]|nr:type IV pilus twitching motility protein PilT [Kiritimatiellia bacterium]
MTQLKSSDINVSDLLQLVVEENASDLHLTVGVPPILRVHGRLQPLDAEPLKAEDTERFMKSITSEEHQQKTREQGGTDFGFGFGKLARFRVSVYKQKGNIGLALRLIPSQLMTLTEIGLPHQVKDLLFKPRGMVLVTGPTGSGKTTTLASMINVINEERDCHVITIEDPIEYYHIHKRSIITQREIGVDVTTFSEALVRALRQDPDVMLVGEMRDLETMEAAIRAAETGHLVFATLHTTGAARTVDRIVDAFPVDQQEQVRTQLASSIVAVISQILLVRKDKPGRIGAFEIMIATPSIRSLIRDKKTFRITSDIQTGARWGMVTLDAHLMALYDEGYISYEDLITKAQDAESLMEKIETMKKKK